MIVRLVAAAALLAAAGCTASRAAPAATGTASASASTEAPRPTVTPPDATCGRLELRIVDVTGGRQVIVGTHAEWPSAAGQFVRVRVYATNLDGTFHTFHTRISPVVDGDGTRTPPDLNAIRIKRQNEDVVLGGENQAEFDLWYDLPTTAKPATLLLYQDLECVRPLPLPTMK